MPVIWNLVLGLLHLHNWDVLFSKYCHLNLAFGFCCFVGFYFLSYFIVGKFCWFCWCGGFEWGFFVGFFCVFCLFGFWVLFVCFLVDGWVFFNLGWVGLGWVVFVFLLTFFKTIDFFPSGNLFSKILRSCKMSECLHYRHNPDGH